MKLFKISLVILIVLAVAFGVYTLVKQDSSDAANSSKNTWYRNSEAIRHPAGRKATIFYKNVDVWEGATKSVGGSTKNEGAYIWRGPNKRFEPGRQYIGCFFYQFFWDGDPYSSAVLDVASKVDRKIKVLHKYTAIRDEIPHSFKGTLDTFVRTCLAFYIPKSMSKNAIELRVKLLQGGIWVRKTKISRIPKTNNELSNQWVFKSKPDNQTVTNSVGF